MLSHSVASDDLHILPPPRPAVLYMVGDLITEAPARCRVIRDTHQISGVPLIAQPLAQARATPRPSRPLPPSPALPICALRVDMLSGAENGAVVAWLPQGGRTMKAEYENAKLDMRPDPPSTRSDSDLR